MRQRSIEGRTYVVLDPALEVEAEFKRVGARRNEVCATERGEEVVQRFLIRQVDHREACAPAVTVALEQVVVAYRHVEKITRRNARRVGVVILSSRSRDADPRRSGLHRVCTTTRSGTAERREKRRFERLPRSEERRVGKECRSR